MKGTLIINEHAVPITDIALRGGELLMHGVLVGPCDVNLTGDVRVHGEDGRVVAWGGRAEIGRIVALPGDRIMVTYQLNVDQLDGRKQQW